MGRPLRVRTSRQLSSLVASGASDMGYYQGDNYGRGDYYQGDILGLGKLAKGAFNIVKGAALGALTGGPLGGVIGGAKAVLKTVSAGAHPSLPQPKGTALMLSGELQQQTGLVNIGPAGAPQTGLVNIAQGGVQSLPGMRGYHLNKSTYETRGGGTSRWPQGLAVHPKGTVLVRNRRMNVGNARALKRALRRAGGFARLARRVMSFTHPRAGRGRFKFKSRAKR